MTDYFALFERSRQPWLDPRELQRTFHEKTLRTHPDAQARDDGTGQAETVFAELNEAYQVLRDPKRRLHHFLNLEGFPPAAQTAAIPADIEKIFPAVAALMQAADGLVQRTELATTALSRSLMSPELSQMQENLAEMLERISSLQRAAEAELQAISDTWRERPLALQDLYLRFSYLARWITELQEKRLKLY